MNQQHLLNRIEILEQQMKGVLEMYPSNKDTSQIGLTGAQIEAKYGISTMTRYRWINKGKLVKLSKNGRHTLYADPNLPVKKK